VVESLLKDRGKSDGLRREKREDDSGSVEKERNKTKQNESKE